MLKAIEVIIEPNGIIRPLETLCVTTPTRAVLTLLEPQSQVEEPEKGSGAAILQFLQQHPLQPEHRTTAAEIDRRIDEERMAWD
jgi:hypothetical protein